MRFAFGDVRGRHRFTQQRPRSFVSAPQTFAAMELSKDQISRDFQRRSILDFFHSIGKKQSSGLNRAGPASYFSCQALS
jgi:hypothetical protein